MPAPSLSLQLSEASRSAESPSPKSRSPSMNLLDHARQKAAATTVAAEDATRAVSLDATAAAEAAGSPCSSGGSKARSPQPAFLAMARQRASSGARSPLPEPEPEPQLPHEALDETSARLLEECVGPHGSSQVRTLFRREVRLYTSETLTTRLQKSTERRLQNLLEAKGIAYTVHYMHDLSPGARAELSRVSGLAGSEHLPQLQVVHTASHYLGDMKDIQELEDIGELQRYMDVTAPQPLERQREQPASAAAAAAATTREAAVLPVTPAAAAAPAAAVAARRTPSPTAAQLEDFSDAPDFDDGEEDHQDQDEEEEEEEEEESDDEEMIEFIAACQAPGLRSPPISPQQSLSPSPNSDKGFARIPAATETEPVASASAAAGVELQS